ncbi:2-amino-4-hydroxy-6-hydroxymethyldihydropteridine diphosphokinase [Halanaerobium sp. Z-7514]|uniref:2-amino-4-hydroxy-6-hydroxymethyldihydropteridine diphosphokinase n=1 Tax=Halanaerobium polyolivorans TaxID=2886943 RepID=A0AAW4WSP4_9FIRM|nr:2-amino-4-hydroxy-6-hydroxymethyldihydropteridine diphosphokinase [Halanaerobium polyolivorans]MCC3144115.1 2-amino-4-hydroxy-6-hydroxymethyldihydropteridine diphosphokinase [Halanaerobium polyolivorans]RQD75221.1 MAG: 2-amino-4-hydroxy-6-hydroxymethyldihydropteridine diphosphokinase [Halanaerobium sp. MSAO_Bac5]
MPEVYLGLGSNIEPRLEYLKKAAEKLRDEKNINLEKTSSVYLTKPYGNLEQEDFLNAVILIKTPLNPEELLKKVLEIERKLGRVRAIEWGPRKIDIDILFYDKLYYQSQKLQIPHPEIKNRAFVMIPLLELIEEEELLLEGKDIHFWLEKLEIDEDEVKLYSEFPDLS